MRWKRTLSKNKRDMIGYNPRRNFPLIAEFSFVGVRYTKIAMCRHIVLQNAGSINIIYCIIYLGNVMNIYCVL